MRKTPTTLERATRSANSRLEANQDELRKAYRKDVAEGLAGKQRYQIRAATEWLRSELTALTPEQRQQMIDHVIELCHTANNQARKTVIPA